MPKFAKRAAIVHRKPVTQSPKYLKLKARVSGLAKRAGGGALSNEGTMLVLAGAAAPALITRFTGKSLPTFGGIDPALLAGGLLLVAGMQIKGKNGARLKLLGTGVAAPAIARAVQTGSVKVSGDDDVGDDEIGDDDVGGDVEI